MVDCKHHLTLEEVDPWQYLDRFTTGGYLPQKQQRARVRKMSAFSEIQNCFRRTLRPINCVPDNAGWHFPAKSFKTEAICLFFPRCTHTSVVSLPGAAEKTLGKVTMNGFPFPSSIIKKKKNIRPRLAKKRIKNLLTKKVLINCHGNLPWLITVDWWGDMGEPTREEGKERVF